MDINGDGIFTISDIWELLHLLYFYPGDWILSKIIETKFGTFFEFFTNDYGGLFSGIISFICWLILFAGINETFKDIFNYSKKTKDDEERNE